MASDLPPSQSTIDPKELFASRILLVAPHPDDESLGCGGLACSLAQLGARIHTVFVTDGGASHPNSATWPRHRLAAEREREGETALRLLGLDDHPRSFLRLRDADMPPDGSQAEIDVVEVLARIVREFRPALALLPWRRDPHRDHRDSFRLAMQALRRFGRPVDVLEYAIWLDEIGAPADHPRLGEVDRVAVDVAAALQSKRLAVEAHRSQTSDLISDDPHAFRLSPETIHRLTGPVEVYWRTPR